MVFHFQCFWLFPSGSVVKLFECVFVSGLKQPCHVNAKYMISICVMFLCISRSVMEKDQELQCHWSFNFFLNMTSLFVLILISASAFSGA